MDVQGKCFVSHEKNATPNVQEWSERGPYRFYFSESYDGSTKSFGDPPPSAMDVGDVTKDPESANVPTDRPKVRPLASMDVFAGCGGE